MKVTPDRAKNARLTAERLTAKPRFLKSETSKLAWSLRASMTTKTAMTATPSTIGTSTEAASQSLVSPAWMIP